MRPFRHQYHGGRYAWGTASNQGYMDNKCGPFFCIRPICRCIVGTSFLTRRATDGSDVPRRDPAPFPLCALSLAGLLCPVHPLMALRLTLAHLAVAHSLSAAVLSFRWALKVALDWDPGRLPGWAGVRSRQLNRRWPHERMW